MDTDNDKRDATMQKSMKVADYPFIEGKFQGVSFASIMPDGKTPSKLPFSLTLLGKKQDVAATVSKLEAQRRHRHLRCELQPLPQTMRYHGAIRHAGGARWRYGESECLGEACAREGD